MSMQHTQLTDDLHERASLFAAGAMTDSERAEYARHLEEDQCVVCRSEVTELQSAMALVAFALPSPAPSPNVQTRLMEQARSAIPPAAKRTIARPWLQWVTNAVALAAVAAAFYLMRTNNDLLRITDELNGRIARLEVQLAEQRNSLAMLTSAGVRVVDLAGQGTNMQASGRIFWDQQRQRWFFFVRDLPPVSTDRTYQLWFVPTAGDPIGATIFNTNPDGSLEIEIPVPDTVTSLKAAAVTTELAGGRPLPEGPFALLGAM